MLSMRHMRDAAIPLQGISPGCSREKADQGGWRFAGSPQCWR